MAKGDINKILIYTGVLTAVGLLVGVVVFRKRIATWGMPVTGRISSPFGMRTHPITKAKKLHNGIDISAPRGTSVKAPMDGVVENAWTDNLNGNAIKIKHTNGWSTGYAHLEKKLVAKGEKVKKGQVIGLVGSTGASTGNHLHFSMKNPKGSHVDPLTHIREVKRS